MQSKLSIDQGSIMGIDQHSTMDAFSTHDLYTLIKSIYAGTPIIFLLVSER